MVILHHKTANVPEWFLVTVGSQPNRKLPLAPARLRRESTHGMMVEICFITETYLETLDFFWRTDEQTDIKRMDEQMDRQMCLSK